MTPTIINYNSPKVRYNYITQSNYHNINEIVRFGWFNKFTPDANIVAIFKIKYK